MQAGGSHSDVSSYPVSNELKAEVNAAEGQNRKRERGDESFDSIKREKHSKEEVKELNWDYHMKFEDFAAIAEKDGGLISIPIVDQFVQVMALEQIDESKNLADVVPHRSTLVRIITATAKEDCLEHFVRIGGLPVLNEWLQEVHKGWLGDGYHKEDDKKLEKLLLSLLHALEKLPVDLDALRTCNVGKSVNLLKVHKNVEVQKKARKLVDTWKKRVNAEMKLKDEAKSGLNNTRTWSSRLSTDTPASKVGVVVGMKSSVSGQITTNGSGWIDDAVSGTSSKDPMGILSKDNFPKGHVSGASELESVVKEEKSFNFPQTHNKTKSWCSGSAGKVVSSWKEEVKNSLVVSAGKKLALTAPSSHNKGHHIVPAATGLQRDLIGKQKVSGLLKTSGTVVSDKILGELPNHNCQRLIVRLPNPGESPSQSISGGCLLDGSSPLNNRGSTSNVERPDSLIMNSRTPEIQSRDDSGGSKDGDNESEVGNNKVDVAEIKRLSGAAVDDGDQKSTDVKHQPSSLVASYCPSAMHVASSDDGIGLLANIAACEDFEREKTDIASNGGGPITEANKECLNEEVILDACNTSTDACNSGERQSKEDNVLKFENEIPSTCRTEADLAEGNALLIAGHEIARASAHEGEGDVLEDTFEPNIKNEDASTIVKASTTCVDENFSAELTARVTSDSQYGDDCGQLAKASDSELQTDRYQVSTSSGVDNVASLQEGSSNGSKDLPSPNTVSKPSSFCAKDDDEISRFCVDDVLEVARQVAKEVELEVKSYSCYEAQEESSLTPEKRISNQDDIDAVPGEGNVDYKNEVTPQRMFPVKQLQQEPYRSLKDEAELNLEIDEASNSEFVGQSPSAGGEILPGSSSGEANSPRKEHALEKDRNNDVDRPFFDLNEGFTTDERAHECVTLPKVPVSSASATTLDRMSSASTANSSPAPIAAGSATEGSFFPPSDIIGPKVEMGSKGSAATSAFRPAEPCHMVENTQSATDMVVTTDNTVRNGEDVKQARTLNIDLNVADNITEEAVAHLIGDGKLSGRPMLSRPKLDLNRVDESSESISVPDSSRVPSMATRTMLDFDLNNGLGCEDTPVEDVTPHNKNYETPNLSVLWQTRDRRLEMPNLPVFGQATASEPMNTSPWYLSSNSIATTAMMIPTVPLNRADSHNPVVAASDVKSSVHLNQTFTQFGGISYQGGMPISSTSVTYTGAAFSHSGYTFAGGFPFGSTSYTINSAPNMVPNDSPCIPTATPSQLISTGAVVSPVGKPYPGSCISAVSGTDATVAWSRPSLDLNVDAITDLELKDELKDEDRIVIPSSGLLSYQQAGNLIRPMKRKEPESGYDSFRSNFKQMAWRG
ncbi:hypothetical protein KP509_04G080100 [Ceratopteris richardii]|uniref:TFIIS N-terminal domain-containing protein n=1 Tax=Ceratopteris richardii TaxID=49495 RepID=A0A8T2V106_CERRI|nr:hypothetical protein KP509_04G080100 [Ceratopteris richardii]